MFNTHLQLIMICFLYILQWKNLKRNIRNDPPLMLSEETLKMFNTPLQLVMICFFIYLTMEEYKNEHSKPCAVHVSMT